MSKWGNNDLALIVSLLIRRNWNARLNVILIRDDDQDEMREKKKLRKIKMTTRIPRDSELYVISQSDVKKGLGIPKADLNLIATNMEMDLQKMKERVIQQKSSYLFLLDSGSENAQV